MRFSIIFLFVNFAIFLKADDWPQWLGPDRDGVWKETGLIEKFPETGPEVLWRKPIGSGYAGPAVAGDHVYIMDRSLAQGAQNAANPFQRGEVPGHERLLCLSAKDGSKVWEQSYPCAYTVSYASGPRATPTVQGEHVYSLGAEGDLLCVNRQSGEIVWQKNFGDYLKIPTPVWGFAAAPLVYEESLICLAGGKDSVAIAFDKNTGDEKWRALGAREPGYSPPTLIEHGGKEQLIIWHPESINSLNPETGKLYWSIPWKLRSGLSVPTPKLDGNRLFLTAFYNGSTMLKLKTDQSTPDILWQTEHVSERRTTHLHSIMPTPVLRDDLIFGTCSYGEFRCLDQKTGKRVWESMQPSTQEGRKVRWFNNFLTPQADRYFLFSERGDIIIAKINRQGFEEVDRAHVIEPNGKDMRQRPIVWSHPAYAKGSAFIRNDTEIIRVNLKKP